MRPAVWDAPGIGFGDLWAALSFCAALASTSGRMQHISRWQGDIDVGSRLEEMLAEMDAARVVVVSDKPSQSMHMDCWSGKRWPTRTRWRGGELIAYQFDGKSSAERKNPPPADLGLFAQWAGASAYPVGLPMSTRACVERLAQARAFVGVCSGMAHLAHSVGVPVFLLRYKHDPTWWHGANPIILCDGMADFIQKVRGS